MVKVGEPQEALQFLQSRGLGPFKDCLDLVLIHGDSLGTDDVTQECRGSLMELAFLHFSIQLVLNEFFENSSDMVDVVWKGI